MPVSSKRNKTGRRRRNASARSARSPCGEAEPPKSQIERGSELGTRHKEAYAAQQMTEARSAKMIRKLNFRDVLPGKRTLAAVHTTTRNRRTRCQSIGAQAKHS
eukprot:2404625-Amphidinium_carterae.1